jgi:hypothetical protein
MTIDLTVSPGQNTSTRKRQVAAYTGPASYATGGDLLDPGQFRLGTLDAILGLSISDGTTVHHGWYNVATGKIMWFVAAGTEVTNGTNLSTFTGRIEVVGH